MTGSWHTGWVAEPAVQPEARVAAGMKLGKALSWRHEPGLGAGATWSKPWRLIQSEESCGGMGVSFAAHQLLGFRGSPWAAWYWARQRGGPGRTAQDVGVRVSDIMWAAETFGVTPYDDWNPTVSDFRILDEVETDPSGKRRVRPVARPHAASALDYRLIEVVQVYADVLETVKLALSRRYPVLYAVGAGGQWSAERNGVVTKRTESIPANHLVTAFEDPRQVRGSTEVLTANWWLGWGDASGCAWAHESWLTSSEFVAVCMPAGGSL